MGRLQDSIYCCERILEMERAGLIRPHFSSFAPGVMARILECLNRPTQEQLKQCWMFLYKTNALGDELSCIAYSRIMKNCRSTVGEEVLSFISCARKFTDPPRQSFRGGQIANELYLTPVPTGKLPLDMPIAKFVQNAEGLLRELPHNQHSACSRFKSQLLNVMKSKFEDMPHFKLLYLRILIEA